MYGGGTGKLAPQLHNRKTHPAVAERLDTGTLHLHAWLYMLETGEGRRASRLTPTGRLALPTRRGRLKRDVRQMQLEVGLILARA